MCARDERMGDRRAYLGAPRRSHRHSRNIEAEPQVPVRVAKKNRATKPRGRAVGKGSGERMSDGASSCPRARKTTAHVTPPRPHTLYHRTIHTPRSQAEERTSLMECGHCDRWRPRRSDTDGPGAPRRGGACVGPSSTH